MGRNESKFHLRLILCTNLSIGLTLLIWFLVSPNQFVGSVEGS